MGAVNIDDLIKTIEDKDREIEELRRENRRLQIKLSNLIRLFKWVAI